MRRVTAARGLALAAAVVLGGCLHAATTTCDNGDLCPAGLRCAGPGDSKICVPPNCGNSRIDPGEACDDGNNISGDGCPADCAAPCGDDHLDPGEVCDDGNVKGGDGCSSDCRSRETCGNALLDPGEACDDGSVQSHDGCSSRCAIETPTWTLAGDAPSATAGVMAHDAARAATVLLDANRATWEWDGSAWHHRSPAAVPAIASVARATMMYDPTRQRVVLLGNLGSVERTVWEWDGGNWIERATTGIPTFASYVATYDTARRRPVVFGTRASDGVHAPEPGTWELDGAAWRRITTIALPPMHAIEAMVYDGRRGKVVLLGGADQSSAPADTWEYDGTEWTRSSSPGPRGARTLRMVFDAARGKVVLFGMFEVDPFQLPVAQTWEWDGTSWVLRAATTGPEVGPQPIAYDALRARVVLVAGTGETWQWDGERWTGPPAPGTRRAGGLSYAAAPGRVVLFGGAAASTAATRDTWTWDGVRWARYPPGSGIAPSSRDAFAIAGGGDGVAIFGGMDATNTALAELWTLRDTRWTRETPATTPPGRAFTAMAYDASRGKLVLFGGADSGGLTDASDSLRDTWEFDGASWVWIETFGTPVERQRHAMAYDPGRQRVVMFGGVNASGLLDDLWEWDGEQWTESIAMSRPPARAGHAMAYDAARGKLVLVGGRGARNLDDTWEWDGTAWQRPTPATVPPARSAHMVAYDAGRQRVVMYGGSGPMDERRTDLWEWDGIDWQERSFPDPLPRSHHAMVYEAGRATTVLFGGLDRRGVRRLNDTWIWSGSSWLPSAPGTAPPPRAGHAMAHDRTRGITVLFGGSDAVRTYGDTWEWDGASWVERAPGLAPPPRRGHALVHDAARGQVLLLGGDSGGALRADQWGWDGTRWTELLPASRPPARSELAVAYDAGRHAVVLFGGRGASGVLGDTWEWDGTRWVDLTLATTPGPAARSGHSLVYDPTLRRVVLFGGDDDIAHLSDVWAWDGARWVEQAAIGPSARRHHAAIYDTARHAMVMFGGDGDAGPGLGDTWWLRNADLATHDEVCIDDLDADGDGQAGCADPDCAEICAVRAARGGFARGR